MTFQETVRKIQAITERLHNMPSGLCFLVDATFYVPGQLAQLNGVLWITRVPAQLKEACALLGKPRFVLSGIIYPNMNSKILL